MRRSFRVAAMSGMGEISGIPREPVARLVCKGSIPVDIWPIVRTTSKLRKAETWIDASDINMISLDRRRWWIWPSIDPERGSTDDPGACGIIDSIVHDYLNGKLSMGSCERLFGEHGLTVVIDVGEESDPSDDVDLSRSTDDPGCEDAG